MQGLSSHKTNQPTERPTRLVSPNSSFSQENKCPGGYEGIRKEVSKLKSWVIRVGLEKFVCKERENNFIFFFFIWDSDASTSETRNGISYLNFILNDTQVKKM